MFSSIFPLLGAATPSIYYVFENSDNLGKAIVLVLILSSIFTWSVMLNKGMALGHAKKYSERFQRQFQSNQHNLANAMLIAEAKQSSSPLADIYGKGVTKLVDFYESDTSNKMLSLSGGMVTRPIKLSEAQYNAIEAVMEREVSSQIIALETQIGMLATMVSVCPFLGLFGTVWGVMLAFAGIALAGKPDFAALAPGVAGALLTTVAGLIVAIPSVIGYNYLTSTIRKITIYMDNFTEEFMVRVKLEQLNLEKEEKLRAAAEKQEKTDL